MATIRKRTSKKGKVSYFVEVRKLGYSPVRKTFARKSDAENFAKKTETAMNEGKYKELNKTIVEGSERKTIKTMTQLIDYFEKTVAPVRYKEHAPKYTCMFDWWRSHVGGIHVVKLLASDISECKEILSTEKIIKGKKECTRGNNTVNKYLMCISAILTYAVKELEIIDVNPCSKVKLMPKPKGRIRFLTEEEADKLISACKEHSDMLYIFFLLLLTTGARYGEVLDLKLENFDFKNKTVHYTDTKNGENRGVAIDKNLIQLIKKYLKDNKITEGQIFIRKKTGKLWYVRGLLLNAIERAGLIDFNIHDSRHTTASYIAMSGGSLLDIAEILGHKSLTMARRYSHLTKNHTAKVLHNAVKVFLKAEVN